MKAPIDPSTGAELFDTTYGERRISWYTLTELAPADAAAFQRDLSAYCDAHALLDVVTIDSKMTEDLVIRWRWRSHW